MSEMVERVARAIAPGIWSCIDDGESYHTLLFHRDESIARARAAIEAMREPTEEMIEAGDRELLKVYRSGPGTNASEILRAMIDQALKEG